MPRIPKILHYTFGMASDFGGKPWSLVHHICLRSAIERIKPEQVLFYFEFEPTGPWWELSRRLVTPKEIAAPREIFKNQLIHVAHRSDVVRLQKLIEHGGIYLDADVFVHRGFDDLLDNSVVLGAEGIDGEYGLANAVILAEPNALFLRRWFEEYRSFRSKGHDEFWSEHSVQVPERLAQAHPREVTVLSHTAFFWPLWTQEHLEWIFESRRPVPLDRAYCTHLWEALSWRYLDGLTVREVRSIKTNFHLWARPLLIDVPNSYAALPLVDRLQRSRIRARRKLRRAKALVEKRLAQARARVRRIIISERKLRQQIFSNVYRQNLWGKDERSKYFSGVESRGVAAKSYVEPMAQLLANHSSHLDRPLTVVDLGCGDFQVGASLVAELPNIVYVGCDIVPELIEENTHKYASERVRFRHVDIISDPIPEGDVYLVRQVLQYLSNAEISQFLERMYGKCVYVTERQPETQVGPVNPDKVAGASVRFNWQTGRGRGVELNQPPFRVATSEKFRATAPPHEVIVTELVLFRPKESLKDSFSTQLRSDL